MSLKAWLAEKALAGKLPDWLYRFLGREAATTLHLEDNVNDSTPWYKSKAKLAAIVGVIVGAIQPISTAFGHPITVPNWVLEVLAGIGVYGVRDAIQS